MSDNDDDEEEEYKFIKNDHIFYNEITGYVSSVDYEYEFDNISDDIRDDLKNEVEFYSNFFIENVNTASFPVDVNNKKISGLNFDIDMYMYEISNTHSRIGVQMFLRDNSSPLQHLSYFAPYNVKNISTNFLELKIFRNYLYNVLFLTHIFCQKFQYHPMLKFMYHEDDVQKMAEIKLRRCRLFCDNDSECAVCYENTITTTNCNHRLCHVCFSNLKIKVCPLCRVILENNYVVFEQQQFPLLS